MLATSRDRGPAAHVTGDVIVFVVVVLALIVGLAAAA